MGLIDKLKSMFGKPAASKPIQPKEEKQETETEQKPARLKKACKECGKMFSYDPNWNFIPNYCKDCKKKFAQEKEEKQRAGAPRKIKRKCKECGKFFTFPNTLPHYPNYCPNCRKAHQAAMKAKYNRQGNAQQKKNAGQQKNG